MSNNKLGWLLMLHRRARLWILRYINVVSILLVIVFTYGCTSNEGQPETTSPQNGVEHVVDIEHDGLMRKYLLYVPAAYTHGRQPMPLVINLHGGGGDAESQQNSSQMNLKADQAGFLIAYPQGTGRELLGQVFGTFNAGRCCGLAKEQEVDDVGFVRTVIDDVAARFTLDKRRVYATGHSNGALLAYRLACELSDRIAAIAPNAAHDAFDNCRPSRPVPVLHFHGTADPAAPFDGGQCGGRTNDAGWSCRSVPDYLAEWRLINSCSENSEVVYQRGDAMCESWSQCSADTQVQLCQIEGAGHTWPGGKYHKETEMWANQVGPLSQDISANDTMWEFFQNHSLPD